MSAVIVEFPRNARAAGERLRAIKAAVEERAKATNATPEQRRQAVNVALSEYHRSGSAAWAIHEGKAQLPPLVRTGYRAPTGPEAA